MRRSEVAGLVWGNLNIDNGLVITYRRKGGQVLTREINELMVKVALLDYLRISGRLENLSSESKLWTRHDRVDQPGEKLPTHSISKAMKKYAKQSGIDYFHLHQTRHTYARIIAEESGSLIATQEALGHKNLATTRVYVQLIRVKKY